MTLTPAERSAVLLVVGLLALGTLWDLRPVRYAGPGTAVPHADSARPAAIPPADTSRVSNAATPAHRVDLNRASLEDLDALPGVGPVLAGRSLELRRRQGAFHDVRDLRAVRGIGPRLYARLEDRVEVGPPP